MKILQVCFGFLPQSVGGTEVYVAGLARQLTAMGHEVHVAVTGHGGPDSLYEGIPVEGLSGLVDAPGEPWRRGVSESPEGEVGLGAGSGTAQALQRYLGSKGPHILHFHPVYLGPMLPLMRAGREMGLSMVCTYHAPTLTCGRGDMMRWGELYCDGSAELFKCTACVLQQKGVAKSAAYPTARVLNRLRDGVISKLATRSPRKLKSLLSMPVQRGSGLESWRVAKDLVDYWVAPANWVRQTLLANGVPAGRIVVSRQGLCEEDEPTEARVSLASGGRALRPVRLPGPAEDMPHGRLRLGYLGRIHAFKGLDVLMRAMAILKGFPGLSLRVAGEAAESSMALACRLKQSTQRDPRIQWLGGIEPEHVRRFLAELDLLVVPSVWLETGPLTVLEAWSAGIPVLGSRSGGIAEWIAEYSGGWLFEPGNAGELARAIRRLMDHPALLRSVKIPARVRTMRDVAAEMIDLYDASLANRQRGLGKCRASRL